MRTLAVVPARGGSRGLPGKNLAQVGGRSLVARAVACARQLPTIDRIVVTSDASEILAEAERTGAEAWLRPAALADDEAPTLPVVLQVLDAVGDADRVVVLQPTSPLRSAWDVDSCLEKLRSAPSAVTVCPTSHPPQWMFRVRDDRLVPVLGWEMPTRRQDADAVYVLNGAVYAARAEHLRQGEGFLGPDTGVVLMPWERSIDVDDAIDLEIARTLVGFQGDPLDEGAAR